LNQPSTINPKPKSLENEMIKNKKIKGTTVLGSRGREANLVEKLKVVTRPSEFLGKYCGTILK
jgi:hypothetical protein